VFLLFHQYPEKQHLRRSQEMASKYARIDPADMSKLRVIVHLMSRGSKEHARELASTIRKMPARDVAAFLVNVRSDTRDRRLRDFAGALRRGRVPDRRELATAGQ